MAEVIPTVSVIILNMSGLNKPIKRQIVRLDKKKNEIQYVLLIGHRLYMKRCKWIEIKRIEKDVSCK